MRRNSGLQKILYLVMVILGIYILYKAGDILLGSGAVQETLDRGSVQRVLEDGAMRTYAPGYTASIEGRDSDGWAAESLKQLVPGYSYLAEGQAGTEENTFDDIESENAESPERGEASKGTENAGDEESSKGTGAVGGEEASKGTGTAEGEESPKGADTAGDEEASKGAESDGDGNASEDTGTGMSAEESEKASGTEAAPALGRDVSADLLAQLEDFNYLLANYFTVDESTMADDQLLDADALLGQDLSIDKNPDIPQILIYHTHSQEGFADSREGETADTVVGMGDILARELQEKYGYQVIHDTGVYDLVDGVLDRSAAYDYARESLEEILEENPSIEVIIDLHRDGVDGQKFVTEIDGRPTSMIMFFNGISRNAQDQPISYLQNPYTLQNLAFSLQLELKAREEYPGFTRNIYLKAERFNLHLRPRSLLIEAGTQLNTVEEEQNAMLPLADILNQVLSGQ